MPLEAENESTDALDDVLDSVTDAPEASAGPDDAGDDDGADEAPAQRAAPERGQKQPQKGPNWRDKKTQRGKLIRSLEEKAASAEKAAQAKYDQQVRDIEDRFNRQLAAERAAWAHAHQQGRQQQTQVDPQEQRVNDIQAAIQAELRLAEKHDDAKGGFDWGRYNKLTNELQRANADIAVQAALKKFQPQQGGQQMTPQQVAAIGRYNQVASEFTWLETNKEAAQQAGAYRRYLIARGRPDTIETDKEACAHVEAELGLGRRPAPSSYDRERAAGLPNGSRNRAPAPQQRRNGALPPPDKLKQMLRGTGLPKDRLRELIESNDDE